MAVHTNPAGDKLQILVLQARWCLVGYCNYDRPGVIGVKEGYVIREWGTEYGLGQLAIEGVTAKTVLDEFGLAEVPLNALLFSIDCHKPISKQGNKIPAA